MDLIELNHLDILWCHYLASATITVQDTLKPDEQAKYKTSLVLLEMIKQVTLWLYVLFELDLEISLVDLTYNEACENLHSLGFSIPKD